MASDAIYMTCYQGPFDGRSVPVTGSPNSVNLEVHAPSLGEDQAGLGPIPKSNFAHYLVSQLVSKPGVPVLIFAEMS